MEMEKELAPAYEPKGVEEKIYRQWEESGYFNPDNLKGAKKPYAIHLPPPNVTGSLHMGHALNATITDILIRYHRMRGYKAVWFPGTDHAGIATQSVVEKQLKKEGISRWDLGREKFVEKVWEWRQKYGDIIIGQLKKIGASADWSRLRFTMDPAYATWVKKAFIHYYEKGWIYRGKRLVSWCTACQTSLSDLEIEYKEEKGKLWHLKYPLADKSGFVVVATTRPETMLGDAAVAVNPKDKRYEKLVGKKVLLPLVNREIPIIADDAIDMTFGTGAVKVTPAHDQTDNEIGQRHNLPMYELINERGKMADLAGKDFAGLKVAEARAKVVAEMEKSGLLEKTEDFTHNVAVCYRSGTVLEPLLSNQWFLKMEKLTAATLKTLKSGQTNILPENFGKTAMAWLENIRDWCISRQIWWGHQLPVYFCKQEAISNSPEEKFLVAAEMPKQCPFCKNCQMVQSADVLDTWFSSALWPFAGFEPKEEKEILKQFYPSSVLITARDIINLWVTRMIFSGLEFMKETPFPDVLIHGTILTKEGKRMSKSLGTGIDPLGLIEKYGADATRFGIIWQAMGNQDIHWDEAAVMAGKKFANKLWNIARFSQAKIGKFKVQRSTLTLEHAEDKEIMEKLEVLKTELDKDIKAYDLGPALHTIYDFVWHEVADKYIEAVKKREDENAKIVLQELLRHSLTILHPFMPFITEEIYQRLFAHDGSMLLVIGDA